MLFFLGDLLWLSKFEIIYFLSVLVYILQNMLWRYEYHKKDFRIICVWYLPCIYILHQFYVKERVFWISSDVECLECCSPDVCSAKLQFNVCLPGSLKFKKQSRQPLSLSFSVIDRAKTWAGISILQWMDYEFNLWIDQNGNIPK